MKKIVVFFLFLFFSACISNQNENVSVLTVSDNDVVSIEYKGFLEDGSLFDSSNGKPLTFTVGKHEVIIGLENALKGMKLNEEKTFTVRPEEAYGYYDEKLLAEISKDNFKNPETLKPGMIVSGPKGEKGIIIAIKDKTIVVDFNHPLAGKTLKFWVKVIEIKR